MIRAVHGLIMGGLFLCAGPSIAGLSLTNYNGFEIRQSGNTWTFGHATPQSTALRGGTVLPSAAIDTAQRALVANYKIPVGKGVPVDVVAKIPASAFARLVVGGAKIATPIGALLTAAELASYINGLGISNIKNTPSGLTGTETVANELWVGNGRIYGSAKEACGVPFAGTFSHVEDGGGGIFSCYAKLPDGRQFAYTTIAKAGTGEPEEKTVDEQTILDRIAAQSGWPSSAAIAAQRAINLGAPVGTETPTVSGPTSVPGEKSTTTESVKLNPGTNTPAAPGSTNTDPGTKTTTKTKTTNVSYSGNNVTTTTTTTTVTNITNNITNITINETVIEETEDDQDYEDFPTDTPLGDIPELYTKKYPEGISGVLNSKFAELKATPLFNLPSLLMPSLPTSGSCPSWQVDLSFSVWADMGTHTVQAPCMVWDFGKVVIIISALLLARRLIFGG